MTTEIEQLRADVARLAAERNGAMAIADKWRGLCESTAATLNDTAAKYGATVEAVARLTGERDAARAELASVDDEDNAIYQRVKVDVDAAMRSALGSCWGHLWGPGLEELGRVVDAGMLRAEKAEAEVARLTLLLAEQANDLQRGWWCMLCDPDTWNPESAVACRKCAMPKRGDGGGS